ncbi:hypothetical protein BDN70DRAFT_38804 [Pholiota conissans]|uniref:F-box domain-containing protein n=1 Tax=Pholiota conissans TaxID=109636 RepID=A0A9P5Z1X0_9AGAR|nr:hypothetical protein BDN70DRAFT_38804 [Pholiota conissans]
MSNLCQYCNYPAEDEYQCDPDDSNACDACRKLGELQEKIKEIWATLVRLKTERSKLKEEANRHHGKFIHRLPPEVVANIFEFCLPVDPMNIDFEFQTVSRNVIWAPLVLSGVCSWWRTVVRSTPQLWSTIILPFFPQNPNYPTKLAPRFVKAWLDRSGELPLSINIYETRNAQWMANNSDVMLQIIKELNMHSARWQQLKYCGRQLFLPQLSDSGENLPQLRKLDLDIYTNDSEDTSLILYPAGLKALSITGVKLLAVSNFDWAHLSELTLLRYSLSDCFEALRRVPNIVRFIFQYATDEEEELSLPQRPIENTNIQHLEIDARGLNFQVFLGYMTFSSLKTLVLTSDYDESEVLQMSALVGFLQTSGCLLENLSLCADLSSSTIISLCKEVPTLRYLQLDFAYSPISALETFLNIMAEFSTLDDKSECSYLPLLYSLSLMTLKFHHWPKLIDIFGTPTQQSIERHRPALQSLYIFVKIDAQELQWRYPNSSVQYRIDRETLTRLIWLRNFCGVKWRIRSGTELDINL